MVGMMTLAPMTLDDLADVRALEEATFPEPWSEQVFRDELAQPSRYYVVARDADGRLAGYAGLLWVADEAHVVTIAVAEKGRGLGTRLMLDLVDHAVAVGAKHLTLEVRASNRPAQDLYRRFGMAPVGVRKRYYGTEDALIMWVHDIDGDDYQARIGEIRRSLR